MALMQVDNLLLARIEELETENEKLRARIEGLVSLEMPLPLEWNLTRSEERIFRCLTRHPVASKELILTALENGRDADLAPSNVNVTMSRLRRKLQPFGIDIGTVWGRGYALTDRSRWTGRKS